MTSSSGVADRSRAGDGTDVTYIGFLLGHGGDALQMLSLANGMKACGARVSIVVPAVETSVTFQRRCDELGIPCQRTPLITADLNGSRQSVRALVRLFRSVDAPLVHMHTGNSCLPRSVMLALELLRFRPAFVTLQSPYETISPGSLRARFWAATARRRLVAVASPSDHGTRFQVRCGIPRELTVTIRNSIDVVSMANGDPTGPRELLGVDAETPVVLFCSRIDGQKRPVDAVRMFAAVASDHPDAILVFVGEGERMGTVSAEAQRLGLADRVRFVGYQTNVPDWLAAATIWVLPTERENFSVALLEAMAAGCPVLTTVCPGNDEVVVDGENAMTFEVGDVEGGAAALRRLLDDPALRARVSSGASATGRRHSVDHMVQAYRRAYASHPAVPDRLRLRSAPPTALQGRNGAKQRGRT